MCVCVFQTIVDVAAANETTFFDHTPPDAHQKPPLRQTHTKNKQLHSK